MTRFYLPVILGLLSPLCSLAAPTMPAPMTDQAANTMEARVQACIGCHGAQGRGVENVYFPRLAGKPAGYLYNQLVAFRDGRRKYAPMNYLLEYLPDPYLKQMADYFANQNQALPQLPRPLVSQEILKHGQILVAEGVPAKKIPACVACHGQNLNGREPGIPGLLGLRSDYISAQLGAWRYGTRTAIAPDCMQMIASSLSEAEVLAVSSWLASLPASAKIRPINASAAQLPMACGSQTP